GDPQFKGTVTPIFPSSAYDYEGIEGATMYPRYYNTPNNKAVAQKLAALENAEEGLVFSPGMAPILTSIFTVLRSGDHAIFQSDLYGGTHSAIVHELPRFGMTYTFVDGQNFEEAIRPETRLIYIETPSNPTLKITDIKAVAAIAKKHNLLTMI